MKIAILYRTHSVYINAIPSVPRIIALLANNLNSKNSDYQFFIACPSSIHKIENVVYYDTGKSYTQSKIYNLKRKVCLRLGLKVPTGGTNAKKVKAFFEENKDIDVLICCKISDIKLARRFAKNVKIIWWHLGIDAFNKEEYMYAVKNTDLIVYTGAVTYNYVYNRIMPEPFPTPVMVARGPYDISLMNDFKIKSNNQIIRANLGYANDEIIILHVGGKRFEKGYNVIYTALHLLDTQSLKIRFISIGHGKNMIYELSNKIIIEHIGVISIDKLYSYYSITDVGVVLPLWMEPGPAVFIEMLYFKTAVIASYTAGIPEMIGDCHDTACLVKQPNDIIDWSENIQNLINNPSKRYLLSSNGEKRAIDYFKEPVIEKWSKALISLTK